MDEEVDPQVGAADEEFVGVPDNLMGEGPENERRTKNKPTSV